MNRRQIEVHIEELVLHGFAPGDGDGIAAAVERALGQLVVEHGLPSLLAEAGEHARVDAGRCAISVGAPAPVAGAEIATAVHGGLRR